VFAFDTEKENMMPTQGLDGQTTRVFAFCVKGGGAKANPQVTVCKASSTSSTKERR